MSAATAACVYQPDCPGCPYFAVPEPPPATVTLLERLAREHGASPPELLTSPGFGRRHRARLSVRGSLVEPQIGIFAARSHRLVHIPCCPLHHPAIEAVIARLLAWLPLVGLEPYDEASHEGLLRTVQLAVERPTGRVQVVLVLRSDLGDGGPAALARVPAPALELARRLGEEDLVAGVFFNGQPERTNTLLGRAFVHHSGARVIEDDTLGFLTFYPPGAFGQSNPVEHDEAVRRILSFVPEGAPVTEFYAGVGSIGLGLVARGQPLLFNELGPDSLEGLRLGLERARTNREPSVSSAARASRVIPGRAGEAVGAYGPESTVVVDPPRKGLDPELLAAFARRPPARLAYLSCGLSSLVREVPELARGGLRLEKVVGFPYFPFTEHIETLALFERD